MSPDPQDPTGFDARCVPCDTKMHTSNHAKFGNGIVKDGEPEAVRILLDLINEAGGR